jgi:hypothetical protein
MRRILAILWLCATASYAGPGLPETSYPTRSATSQVKIKLGARVAFGSDHVMTFDSFDSLCRFSSKELSSAARAAALQHTLRIAAGTTGDVTAERTVPDELSGLNRALYLQLSSGAYRGQGVWVLDYLDLRTKSR